MNFFTNWIEFHIRNKMNATTLLSKKVITNSQEIIIISFNFDIFINRTSYFTLNDKETRGYIEFNKKNNDFGTIIKINNSRDFSTNQAKF